ncbi:beta/gamma crystallin family protein [Methanosarcina acetivorans]|nr:beta/gamma crystallin family protein [Methanosarcina acetivorans]
MGKEIFGIVRKVLYVLLLIFFAMSATAGTVNAAEVIVYEHVNFGGKSFDATSDQPGAGDNLNDKISSIKVKSGTWRFYEYINYGGRYWDLGPGEYSSVESAGIPDNSISSFRQI